MGLYIKDITLDELNDCVMVGAYFDKEDVIEVSKPHGRLIGADDVIEHAAVNGEDGEFVRILTDYIDEAPTIIESEGE